MFHIHTQYLLLDILFVKLSRQNAKSNNIRFQTSGFVYNHAGYSVIKTTVTETNKLVFI